MMYNSVFHEDVNLVWDNQRVQVLCVIYYQVIPHCDNNQFE